MPSTTPEANTATSVQTFKSALPTPLPAVAAGDHHAAVELGPGAAVRVAVVAVGGGGPAPVAALPQLLQPRLAGEHVGVVGNPRPGPQVGHHPVHVFSVAQHLQLL